MSITKSAAIAVALVAGALPLLASAPAGADRTKAVNVKLLEFKVRPKPTRVKPGTVRFNVKNIGGVEHEMVVVRTDGAALPLAADGSVDEDQVPEDAKIGEVEDVAPKKAKTFTAENLAPGSYTLFCNVVETAGGTTLAHYAQGMHTNFTVG